MYRVKSWLRARQDLQRNFTSLQDRKRMESLKKHPALQSNQNFFGVCSKSTRTNGDPFLHHWHRCHSWGTSVLVKEDLLHDGTGGSTAWQCMTIMENLLHDDNGGYTAWLWLPVPGCWADPASLPGQWAAGRIRSDPAAARYAAGSRLKRQR